MKKIWRIRKRLIAGCLVVVLVLSIIFVPTKKAYAIVGFDDAAFILAMMAAAGVGFVGYSMFDGGSNPQDDFNERLAEIEDQLKDCYNKAVGYILTNGGGGGDPDDFDPDNDDPEKKPTTWEKLKEWWKKHPEASLSIGVNGSVIGAIMIEFAKNIDEEKVNSINLGDIKLTDYHKSVMSQNISKYPYFVILFDKVTMQSKGIGFSVHPISYYWASTSHNEIYALLNNSLFYTQSSLWFSRPSDDDYSVFPSAVTHEIPPPTAIDFCMFPLPDSDHIYDTREEAILHQYDHIVYASPFNPDSVLDSDQRINSGEKDKPLFDNVVLPSPDQITGFISKLAELAQTVTDPAQLQQLQRELVSSLIKSITNVSPSINPTPDPSPKPDPSPEPDPDAPATDKEAAKYTADLTTVFPFCIPFDLIRAFKVLSAEGEAPVYKMPLKIDYKSIHVSEAWQIDMSDFASVIQILRVMETLGFIVGLILVTRKLIRG